MPANRGYQLLHSDPATAELEALGLDSSLFGAVGIPAPIFQALAPRRANVFDESANTFGTVDEPASFTRSTVAQYRGPNGTWKTAAINEIRPEFTAAGAFLGYCFEPGSTNKFLNSDAPATQDISLSTGLHTLSVHGTGSVTSSNGTGTATGHGAATDGAPVTINVTGAGTITFTVAGSPTYAQVEAKPYATSPIITAGASVARGADALSWTPLISGFSQDTGTLLLRLRPKFDISDVALGSTRSIISLRAGNSLLYHFRHSGGTFRVVTTDGSGFATTIFPSPPSINQQFFAAVRWSSAAGNMQSGAGVDNTWTWSGLSAYDGAYSSDNLFNVFFNIDVPWNIQALRVFNRYLTQAECEARA